MNKVNIVVAAYNEKQIYSTLQSLFYQEWTNYRVLLGIDACPETLQIVKSIKNKWENLDIFYFYENSGPYMVLNSLIHESDSEWISVFGADDLMLRDFLWYNMSLINGHGSVDCFVKTMGANYDDKKRWVSGSSQFCGVTIFRKSDWGELNGFAPWRCGADTDFNNRLARKGVRPILANRHTYLRRLHPGSLTNSHEFGYNSLYRGARVKEIKERLNNNIIRNDELVRNINYDKL